MRYRSSLTGLPYHTDAADFEINALADTTWMTLAFSTLGKS